MRTIVDLADDAFAAAQSYAQACGIELDRAMSELILRGKARQGAMKQVNGVWVFDLPSHTPTVSARMVAQLLDESP